MSIAECLGKLVSTGKISKTLSDEAMALYERSKGEYARHMGPADAEAAAGLAAAKAMQAGARKLKNDAAKQAIGFANFERTALEHKDGIIAGTLDQLAASLRGRGTRNVDSVREDIWARMSSMMGDAMSHFAPGITGVSKQQIASAKNLIREVFGVQTGDGTASLAAKGWEKVKTYAEDRAKAAGRNFDVNENWRVPQPWNSEQVRKVTEAEFVRDFQEALGNGGITRLWNTRTGKPVTADDVEFILKRAYADITGTGGTNGVFSREMRTFEFAPGEAGADAWLKLQQKYGVGDDVFGMLTGHMQKMASEIALAEVIAPNHGAVIRAILPRLKAAEAQKTTLQRLNPIRMLESAKMVEKTYDVLTGRANAVDGPAMAGFFGGLRSLNSAAQLKGAVISSVPGDSVTTFLAANYDGIPATRIISGVIREISRGGKGSKQLAARLQLTAHSAMDYGHGYRFFQDQIAGPMQLRWLATTMIRAQGLQAWTEMMKRVFTMEFMGHLADHTKYSFAKLQDVNAPLARFLDRFGINEEEWNAIRATNPLEVEGARFLDTTQLDSKLGEKLRTAVIQERRFAVLEPDARIRAITTGGLPQGTLMGEIARNTFLFKSFSMTMAATHMMRVFSAETWGEMAKLGLPFTLLSIAAGAASMQAKNIIYGKDPENMASKDFWTRAALQGGGFGVYGDMVNSAFTRNGRSPVAEFSGPVTAMAEDALRLTSGQFRRAFEGKDTTFANTAVQVGKRYTPGTYYTKLAVDRLIWDQLQTMVDPDYRGSFIRMEERARKNNGQTFWYAPGDAVPKRGPDLSKAIQ